MKNLKKLLAMSIVFALIISSMSAMFIANAYDDVTTSNPTLYEAVSVLSDFGIVNGKDATNFGAADPVKRSEAAKMLVCALGLKSAAEASMGKTSFKDVAADHWASGYINVASSQGFINGYGDGNFGPDDNVTYEQFLKMGMSIAGYQPVAAAKGGYPTGYVVVANDNGVTKGVKVNGPANATRGDIAIMLYNLLSTPILEQTGWGNNIDYEVQDGKGDRELKTIMTEKLNILKFRCEITANEKSSTDGPSKATKGKIKYTITDDFNLNDNDYKKDTSPEQPKVGTTKAADYLGYQAVIYIGEDSYGEDVVVSIVPDTARVKELNLKSVKYFDEVGTTSATMLSGTFKYWINTDDTKSEEAEVAADASLMINGQYVTDLNKDRAAGTHVVYDTIKGLKNGSVKFVNNDTNNNDEYDLIFITTYQQAVVESVDVQNKTIECDEGDFSTLSLNPDDFPDKTKYTYTLKNKAGQNIELSAIKKYDVIAVAFSGTATTMDTSDYMDIVVLSDTVQGTVLEYNAADSEYKIGDKYFEESSSNDPGLDLEDSGTFILDIDGKVILQTKVGSGSDTPVYKYAYLIDAGADGGLSDNYKVKVFNKDGAVVTYTLSSTVKVNYNKDKYISYASSNADGRKLADLTNLLKVYTANPDGNDTTGVPYGPFASFKTKNSSEIKSTSAYVNGTVKTEIDKLIDLRNISKQNLVASKVVDLTISSDNYVKEISFPNVSLNVAKTSVEEQYDTEDYTLAKNLTEKFVSDSKSFDNSYNLVDSTKVFYIPENEQTTYDNFELRSTTSFSDDKEYTVTLFDLNKDYNIGLVLLTDDSGFSAYDSRLAVVDRIGTGIVDGDTVDVITVFYDGKTESYPVSTKGYKVYLPNKKAAQGTDIDDISLVPGDAIQFTVNGSKAINNIAKIFDYVNQNIISADTLDTTVSEYANEDATFVFAKVYDGGSSIKIQENPNKTLLKASSDLVKYIQYSGYLTNKTTKAKHINSGSINEKLDGHQTYVVARMYKNKAYDIVQYAFEDDTKADANTI